MVVNAPCQAPRDHDMPLLDAETSLHPDDLLERTRIQAPEDRWWVLNTRPRAEKALARSCLARQLQFYLPLYHKRWRSAGRYFNSYLPLFPGYLFLQGDDR